MVVLAYLFHGVFLLTSIGIGIGQGGRGTTRWSRRSRPAVNVAANFALIPRFGMMGAAWATVFSYA